jgi:hypothetical protein
MPQQKPLSPHPKARIKETSLTSADLTVATSPRRPLETQNQADQWKGPREDPQSKARQMKQKPKARELTCVLNKPLKQNDSRICPANNLFKLLSIHIVTTLTRSIKELELR